MICCLATDRGCLNTQQEGTENMYMRDSAFTLHKCGSLKYTHILMLTNNETFPSMCEKGFVCPILSALKAWQWGYIGEQN